MIEMKKNKCYGCGACSSACPESCIQMKEDREGFLYPYVDKERCISCGLCKEVCPSLLEENLKEDKEVVSPFAVGGFHKDKRILESSSSGGAFTLFANEIIRRGGLVYGCAMDKNLMAVHTGVSSVRDLDKLKKSKYMQSTAGGVFHEIKKVLYEGKEVLFTGTPCECAGLEAFLGKTYNNLYLCDFVCHGVPSRRIFRDWINYQETRYHDKIVDVLFRIKKFGWNSSGLQMGTKTTFLKRVKWRIPALTDPYMNGFLENICLRPSCYCCLFKGKRLHSDITMADFWGIKKIDKSFANKNGMSLILLNTQNGKELFRQVKNNFEYKEYDWKRALSHNKSYFESAEQNPKRNNFFADYWERGIAYVIKKYLMPWHWIKYRLFR